jgi:hypothetical protein
MTQHVPLSSVSFTEGSDFRGLADLGGNNDSFAMDISADGTTVVGFGCFCRRFGYRRAMFRP